MTRRPPASADRAGPTGDTRHAYDLPVGLTVSRGRIAQLARHDVDRYVQKVWLPSRHVEVSTMAGYRSYLDKHFLPYFGDRKMAAILPSTVQDSVTQASAAGLSPSSVRKYHVMLHSVFKRAVRDRVLASNPCEGIELPKVIARRGRILTPAEYGRLLAVIPERHRLLLMVDIETGLRWGELAPCGRATSTSSAGSSRSSRPSSRSRRSTLPLASA